MRQGAAAVDADVTLTYHSFFMSRPFATSIVLVAALSCAAGLGAGCAGSDEETKPITYSLTAKQNYEKGLAELGIADTQFARGNYNEAIDSYKSFVRLHPTHEKVEDGYVAFRICESYFKDMPDDVWILPPSYEKDQSAVVDAQREIEDFRKKHAGSPYMPKADELRKEVMKRLVDHEVYVARFYLKSDHPKAAAMRLEGAIRRYPGSGREPELLFSLGETYLHMGDPRRAMETFERVINEHHSAPQARRSELYVEYIVRRHPELKAAPAAPAQPAGEAPSNG